MNFNELLDGDKAHGLSTYLKEELKKDLDFFNEYYGYHGGKKLIQWLIINKVFQKKIFFIKKKVHTYLWPNLSFMHRRKMEEQLTNIGISPYTQPETIPFISSFLEVASDGMGGYYFMAMTHNEKGLIYYDHEGDYITTLSIDMEFIIKKHPEKNLAKVFEIIFDDIEIREYLKSINIYQQHPNYTTRKLDGGLAYMASCIQNIKPIHFSATKKPPCSPFDKGCKSIKTNIITNDYIQYDNIRLEQSSKIIAIYFYYFLSKQFESLQKCIENTKGLKGQLYNTFRDVFQSFLQGDNSKIGFTNEQLDFIRKNLPRIYEKHPNPIKESRLPNNPEEHPLAIKLIGREKMEKTGFLDLGNCDLHANNPYLNIIWEKLSELTHLTSLSLAEQRISYADGSEYLNYKKSSNTDKKNVLEEIPEAISKLTRLKQLFVSGGNTESKISELKHLENLKQLELLSINDCQLTNLRGLDSLTSLKELTVSRTRIKKLEGLERCNQITHLILYENKITSLSGLSNLTELKVFRAPKNKLSSTKGLSDLHKLEEISLNSNQIKTTSGIKNLPALKLLNLGFNKINKVNGISKLEELVVLDLGYNEIVQIENLSSLKKLIRLHLTNNQIEGFPASFFPKSIKTIYANKNKISSLTSFNDLPELSTLYLANNQLKKLDKIEGTPELSDFEIGGNQIKKIENISHLTQLNRLDARENEIESIEGIDKLPVLKNLHLDQNNITSIESVGKSDSLIYLYLRNNGLKPRSSHPNFPNIKTLNI